jgi:hypothetical protein
MTSREVADKLSIPHRTIRQYCLRGLFAGAKLVQTPRGPVWSIPASALARFRKPTQGRPCANRKEKQ